MLRFKDDFTTNQQTTTKQTTTNNKNPKSMPFFSFKIF